MGIRGLSGVVLLASALVAGLGVTVVPVARLLQAGIALSVVYVGYLAWRGWRAMREALAEPAPGRLEPMEDAADLPFVSLVVPARDEATVIGNVVRGLAALRYHVGGTPHYEVTIVDDGSTDATGEVALAASEEADAGRYVRVVRRELVGPSTKGAAMAFAQPYCRGEVIGVLDADARVDPAFLERVMRAWRRDPNAGALQARRAPQVTRPVWLTGAQADEQLMDLASQHGRWATDGTAELRGNGMFVRRAALDRAGGWSTTALTEDLDLSTRLAAIDERVALAPDAVVGEEAVTTLSGLWRQRMRWAEGSLRRLMEHGPRMLRAPIPLGRKLDFLAFIGEFVLPPLFVAAIAASVVTIPLPQPADWTVPASLFVGYGLGSFLLAVAGLGATGERGLRLVGRATRGALFLSHWLLVVPGALLRICLAPGPARYVRTPRAGERPGTARDR